MQNPMDKMYYGLTRKPSIGSTFSTCASITIGAEPIHVGWLSTPMIVRLVCIVGGCVQGYDISLMSATLVAVQKEFGLTTAQTGLLMAMPLVVGFAVPLFAGVLSDQIGRKMTLALTLPVASLGLTLQALSHDIVTYTVGRTLATIAVDSAATITVLYVSEVAPAGRRGAFTCIEDVLLRVGYVLAWSAMYMLGTSRGAWRVACMFGGLAPLLFTILVLLPCVPESPRFLHSHGRHEEAHRILATTVNGNEEEIRDIIMTWDEMATSRLLSLIE